MRADATELGNGFDRLTARLHEYLLKNLTAHASVLCLWQAKSNHWKQYAGDLFYGASVFVGSPDRQTVPGSENQSASLIYGTLCFRTAWDLPHPSDHSSR